MSVIFNRGTIIEELKSDYLIQWECYQELEQSEESSCIDTWMKAWDEAVDRGGFDNHSFYSAFDEFPESKAGSGRDVWDRKQIEEKAKECK